MPLKVLMVHPDAAVGAERAKDLAGAGCDVLRATSVATASEVMMRETVDSIVCSDELRAEVERAYGEVLPVIPMDGEPTATLAKMLARLARRSLSPTVQLSLAATLEHALLEASLDLQPVVDLRDGVTRAYRAGLKAPGHSVAEIADIARELGRGRELARCLRRHAARALDSARARLVIPCDLDALMDTQLYESPTWTGHGWSIILAVSERDVMALPTSARDRLDTLRVLGFTLAVRVGTDIAGLTSVGMLQPSFALLDIAELGASGPVVTRVVASIVSACKEAGVSVIADVKTPTELACARATGCMLAMGAGAVQGALA